MQISLLRSLVLLCALLLQGCIGYTELRERTEPPSGGTYLAGDIIPRFKELKKQDYLAAYGKPLEVGGADNLTFSTKREAWCGALVWVVIPVPFVAPVCEETVQVQFENDVAVIQTDTNVREWSRVCSPLLPLISWHGEYENPFCDWDRIPKNSLKADPADAGRR